MDTAQKAKLKGFNFSSEGTTIYTEKGLEETRDEMKRIYGK
jgi:hypothetical protein